jgi:hypothetical protein
VPKKGRRKTTGGVLSWMFGGKKRNETTRVSPVNGRSRRPPRLPVTNAEKIDNEHFVFTRNSEEKVEHEKRQETKEDFTEDLENVENGNDSLKSIILTFVATDGPYDGQSFTYFLGGDDYELGDNITIGSHAEAIWCLQEDKQIEELHASIVQRSPKSESLRIYPYDLAYPVTWRGSVNEIQLKGGKPMNIRDGDTIVLGQSTFTLTVSYLYNSTADILNRVDRNINMNQTTTPATFVVAAPRIN